MIWPLSLDSAFHSCMDVKSRLTKELWINCIATFWCMQGMKIKPPKLLTRFLDFQ